MSTTHRHLGRLQTVWVPHAVYYLTVCTHDRKPLLISTGVPEILIDEWRSSKKRHGWNVGAYVIMPDHAHFMTVATETAVPLHKFMQQWKGWTSKRIKAALSISDAVWQREFFDHVIRSDESYQSKVLYIFNNPVRAGLVAEPEQWPYYGHIHFDQL